LEAVRPSAAIADQRIKVEVDLDGDGTQWGWTEDAVRVTCVEIQTVTRADDGSIVKQPFFFNCVPCPQFDVATDDCSIAADGTVSLSVSGTLTDAASDLVDDPAKQLQWINVYRGSQLKDTINLTNTATPDMPWKPYKFESSFSTNITFPTDGFGEYRVDLETSENVAGCSSTLTYSVFVDIKSEPIDYTIELAADLDDQQVDNIIFFAGPDRPEVDDDILDETGIDTRVFTNELFWADVEVEFTEFAGLTPDVDVLTARVRSTYSNDTFDEFEVTFVENAETSNQFTATIYEPIDGTDLGGDLNLVLPGAFNPSEADTVTAYIGARDPSAEDFPLVESGPNTLSFNGNTSWADSTVTLVDFQGLTAEVDTLHTQWSFLAPDGSTESYDVQMTETGAETRHFVYNLGIENVYDVSYGRSSTDSGTFLPFIVRIKAPAGVLTGDTVNTFDRDWALKRLNYGDGEYEYVIDDQEKPVVFLPAAYAQTHIQCKPIIPGQVEVCFLGFCKKLSVLKWGLIIRGNDDISDMLSVLEGWEKRHELYKGTLSWMYTAADIEHGLTRPVSGTIQTEIHWRHVWHAKRVTIFNSREEYQDDVNHRLYAVAAARAVRYAFGKERFREEFWKTHVEVAPGKSCYDAIADMFGEHAEDYSMYCTDGARYVFLRAASQVKGRPVFDLVIQDKPSKNLANVRYEYNFPRQAPQRATSWIPGDWGYFENPGGDPLHAGENVIYLGGTEGQGCFEDGSGFGAAARFWGHGLGELSFAEMLAEVDKWGENEADVTGYRWCLRQPPYLP